MLTLGLLFVPYCCNWVLIVNSARGSVSTNRAMILLAGPGRGKL